MAAGKTDTDNEYVSLKLARPADTWFHASGCPGSHTPLLARDDGVEPDRDTLCNAATIAAWHGKARNAKRSCPTSFSTGGNRCCIGANMDDVSGGSTKQGSRDTSISSVIPLGEFVRQVDDVLGGACEQLKEMEARVEGEVLRVKTHQKRRFLIVYDPKDRCDVEVKCDGRLPDVEVGDLVHVRGRCAARAAAGTVQLLIEAEWLDPRGRSRRRRAIDDRLERLRTNGAERTEPQFPIRKITIVSGRQSKAVEDFKRAANGAVEVARLVADLKSPESIAGKVDEAAARGNPVLLTRGGGSAADLEVFNEEAVINAVSEAGRIVPVLVAVGHASDRVACGEAAAQRFGTPADAGNYVGRRNRQTRRQDAWTQAQQQGTPGGPVATAGAATEASARAAAPRRVGPWWFLLAAVSILLLGATTGYATRAYLETQEGLQTSRAIAESLEAVWQGLLVLLKLLGTVLVLTLLLAGWVKGGFRAKRRRRW